MSRELIGSNREVVGSPAYFEKLHNAHFSGTLRCSRGDDFARSMESLAGNRYCHLFKPNLERIVRELEQDLEQGLRDNDYIRDENADHLRTTLKQLERCGVQCYSLERKVNDLAWFVGGDPDKIRRLQSKLNDLGVGQHLKEDGVYGGKTKEAVDDAIEKVSDFLADPNKMRLLDQTVDAIASALDFAGGPQSQIRKMHDALEKSRRELQRIIWKLGAEYYLRPRGYDVAALLLEHSIESSPSNLHFSQSHGVTQKILNSKGFKTAFGELEKNIRENPAVYAVPGKIDMDFGKTGDTDLYYGIGKCEIKYTCSRGPSSVRIRFSIEDKYNFDYLRSISGDVERGIKFHFDDFGNLANDAGLLSQADSVISIFYTYINFEKTIEMEGVYL